MGNKKGQALVEVLVAVSILTIGLLGIVTLLSRALSLNRVVADNYTATYLAAEGIEVAKNIIDGDVAQGKWGSTSGSYELDYRSAVFSKPYDRSDTLLFDPDTNTYSYCAGACANPVQTPFSREVQITPLGDGTSEIRVNSRVTWTTRGGGESKVDLEDHFYRWK